MATPRPPLIETFVAELDDRIRAFDRDLLILEKQSDAATRLELFKSLFRTAHSLKGAAAAAGVELIEIACHQLEEAFAAARDGRVALSAEAFRLFFACVDAIEDAARRLRRNEDLVESPLALLLPQLDQAISQAVEPPGIPALCADGGMAVVQPVRDQPGAVVRVAAQKLDLLLTRSAELVAIAARADDKRDDALTALRMLVKECRAKDRMPSRGLKHLAGELNRFGAAVDADTAAIAHAAAALDAEIRRVRMQPFSAACEGFERIVRDLCLACAKDADLVIEGGNIELDRSIIERVKDPLLHLLRNAVDHGIEPASVRRAAGKPPTGRITVGAALRGARVEVTVADDGPGLDLASIRAAADARHLPPAEGHDLAQYVFLPGFTTAEIVTEVSGRGVGLDAVKTSAEAMRGSADVTFAPDRGTTFVLTLPLTLTTIRAVLVEAKGQCFALDVALVERVLRADRGRLTNVEDRTFILSEDGAVPVVSLSNMLGLTGKPAEAKGDQTLPLVLLAADNRRIALLVDKFLGEQEILVRSLGKRLIRVRYLSGGTTLPGGRIAFILNVPDLVRNARRRVPLPIMEEPAQASSSATRTRVLLADDSLTTRTLERSILEVAGYEVIAAADGREAWRLLQEQGADIVVSDIEMPFMDGIALTDAIRRSPRFKELPVILVTALESEQNKMRGLQAGANVYLVKSAFDQKSLLDALAQFL